MRVAGRQSLRVVLQPAGENEENLRLMRLLDEQYTRTPFYGSRRLWKWPILRRAGIDLRRVSDGKVLGALEVDLFIHDSLAWQMKEYYLASSERNYPLIVSKIIRRSAC